MGGRGESNSGNKSKTNTETMRPLGERKQIPKINLEAN